MAEETNRCLVVDLIKQQVEALFDSLQKVPTRAGNIDAIVALCEVLDSHSGDREYSYLKRARAEFQRGNYEPALFHARKALEINESSEGFMLSGASQYGMHKLPAAKVALVKCLEIDPKHFHGRSALTYTLKRMWDYEGVLDHLSHYDESEILLSDEVLERSIAQFMTGNEVEALGFLEAVRAGKYEGVPVTPIGSNSFSATITMAMLYNRSGKADKAVELLEPFAADNERNPGFQNKLGFAYLKVGENEKAIECTERALEIWDRVNIHFKDGKVACQANLGRAYLALGDEEEAMQYFQECMVGYAVGGFRHYNDMSMKAIIAERAYEEKEGPLILGHDFIDGIEAHTLQRGWMTLSQIDQNISNF